jgi:Tfp pilus assembly protein FimT
MVVISLFGLFLVLSIPAFGRFQRTWRLVGEADQMATTMRTARSAAINKNINAVFEFDTTNQEYFYFEDDNGDGTKNAAEYQSATHEIAEGVLISGHTLPTAKITFEPRGNAQESGAITVTNNSSRTLTINIFGGTGNVRVD